MVLLPPRRELERAFLMRDRRYDGLFVAGVQTTRIFCLASCPAKRPLPDRVTFFATTDQAVAAGYRPCLRCRPLTPASTPSWIADVTDALERPAGGAGLQTLLPQGVEPAGARRAFVRAFGMSMAAYRRAWRIGFALERLQQGVGLDEAVFDSGFRSHSGFREAFARMAGVPPGRAAAIRRLALTWIETPVGRMVAGATDTGICLLAFTDQPGLAAHLTLLRRRCGIVAVPARTGRLVRLRTELEQYFAGTRREFSVRIVLTGTSFEEQVWAALQQIPFGEVRTYREIAHALGRPAAVRAVGRAIGANRLAILIPCHRVLGTGGALTGYAGGLWRKRRLLDIERASAPRHVSGRDRFPGTTARDEDGRALT